MKCLNCIHYGQSFYILETKRVPLGTYCKLSHWDSYTYDEDDLEDFNDCEDFEELE